MAAQLSPEQLAQLERQFASQLETRVAAAREELRADMASQVGARFEALRGAGAGLEAQLAEARAANAQLAEQLAQVRAEGEAAVQRLAEREAILQLGVQNLRQLQEQHAAVIAERDSLRTRLAAAPTGAAGTSDYDAVVAERDALRARLAAAPGGADSESRVDKKEFGRLFSDEKSPKFSGDRDHWPEWEIRFVDKIDRSIEGGHAILRLVEQFGEGGNPDVVPFDDAAVTERGWTAISKAVYSALTSCCPVGSTPSLHLAA